LKWNEKSVEQADSMNESEFQPDQMRFLGLSNASPSGSAKEEKEKNR
jgi:hypothetical protein